MEAIAVWAPAPDPLWGAGLFWELRRQRSSVRVSAWAAGGPPTDVQIGGAAFRWMSARLEGCPLRFGALASVSMALCGAAEGGAIHASGMTGTRVNETTTEWRPWLALGALTQVEIPLSGPLHAELRFGVTVPLLRDTFYFRLQDGTSSTVHQVPAVGGAAGAAIAYRLP